ncbi:MAG: ATP synthase F0 subunit B [SAR324 cluster bacterium]|nr:ATP synthase F0 subunit B [SAR324 cluster bacterium]
MPNFPRVFIYSFILSPGIFVQSLLAAEEGASASPLDFVWKVVNLLILIGIIYWFARKPVSSALRNSAENARNQLEESRRMEEKSMAQMKQMREKLTGLEKETKAMVEKAKQEASAEKERIIEEGKKEIERMREQARFSIEQEYRKAEYRLRQWLAAESVKLAEEKLKQEMSGTRQNKLVKEYLDQLSLDKEVS